MSGVDELDEVPDAASPDASASKLRRDARQLFREKHGRDLDTLHKSSLGTGNSTAWPGDATDIYATSYATLLERTARALFDQGSGRYYIPGDRFDLPSLSSDDAADITLTFESTSWDDEAGCFGYARRLHRLHVLERIEDAVLEKKERDAAVEREAATLRRGRPSRCSARRRARNSL